MAPQSALLEEPVIRQTSSSVDEAIQKCNEEIERRGRLLLADSSDIADIEQLMRYSALVGEIGYEEMERIGRDILSYGGTFPVLTVLSVREHRGRFVVRAVEDITSMEFTIPCRKPLRQYTGRDIGSLDALQAYVGEEVTLDVAKNGHGYEAVMIGKASQVLNDGSQATRLDLIR